MKVWTCNSFTGVWVGAAAVVYAETAEDAAALLNDELRRRDLPGDATADEMHEFPSSHPLPQVRVLCDGDY